MKRYWVAAGTLLLSTSTIAWAQTDAKADPASGKDVVASEKEMTTDKSAWTDKSFFEPAADKMALASSEDKEVGFDDAKVQTASWQAKDADFSNVKAQTASVSDWSDKGAVSQAKFAAESWDEGKVQTASWSDEDEKVHTTSLDSWSTTTSDGKLQTASFDKPDQSESGMGGPLEETTGTTKSLDLTPRQATENYPPCSPGPGDDRCIQLYEPGVRAQLASWNQPTGGLADHSATAAMGGPYEPVDVEDDGKVELAAADTDPTLTDHSEYQGVGGPIESQSGYPPCSFPGPGDDRCIQLYESGVTGAGN